MPAKKNFERAAEGIRKQDCGIERWILTKQARRYENRFRRQHDDFIDFGNNFPEGASFSGTAQSDVHPAGHLLMARTAGTLMTASPSQLLLESKCGMA